MAGIDGIGNGKVDWSALLNSISNSGNVNNTQNTTNTQNLVLSDSDKNLLLGMLKTPGIDAPVSVDDAATKLESLLDKVKNGAFTLTNEQMNTFTTALNTMLTKVKGEIANITAQLKSEAAGGGVSVNTSKVLLDIYSMMCLLAECAQKMKDAQREQRQAESSAIITSIQNQADAQRSAALTGLIAGGIICAVQVCATAYSAYKSVQNTRAEAALSNEFNVNQAASELGTAQTQAQEAKVALKNFTDEHPLPAEGQPPDVPEIAQQRAQLQARVDETKATLVEKRVQFESNKQQMKHSDGYDTLQEKQAWTRASFDLAQAFGNFGQTVVRGVVDLKQAEATEKAADQKKAEEALEQTKDLMASFQEVIDQVQQLAQAVLAAENESMRNAIQA